MLLRSKVEEIRETGLGPTELGESFLNEEWLKELTARMEAVKAAIEKRKKDQ